VQCPTIVPALIHNCKAVQITNPNLYLQLFTASFQRLAKGVEMYCASVNRTIKVFAFLHSVYGDLPGRCEIAGLKSSIMASR
jgi:hypothetical protein